MVKRSPLQVVDTEHAAEVHRGWSGCTCGVTAGSPDLPESGRREGGAVFGGTKWCTAGGHTHTAPGKECIHQCGECVSVSVCVCVCVWTCMCVGMCVLACVCVDCGYAFFITHICMAMVPHLLTFSSFSSSFFSSSPNFFSNFSFLPLSS